MGVYVELISKPHVFDSFAGRPPVFSLRPSVQPPLSNFGAKTKVPQKHVRHAPCPIAPSCFATENHQGVQNVGAFSPYGRRASVAIGVEPRGRGGRGTPGHLVGDRRSSESGIVRVRHAKWGSGFSDH